MQWVWFYPQPKSGGPVDRAIHQGSEVFWDELICHWVLVPDLLKAHSGPLDFKVVGTMTLWNVGNYSPIDMASYPGIPKSSSPPPPHLHCENLRPSLVMMDEVQKESNRTCNILLSESCQTYEICSLILGFCNIRWQYELMVTAYHVKAAVYTECNWFCLVCSQYVGESVKNHEIFISLKRLVHSVISDHFLSSHSFSQMYQTQCMFLTHADELLCLQLHTIAFWFFLFTLKVSILFT